MNQNTMTIYTISSFDDCQDGTDHLVAGSYTSRDRAVKELTDYIMDRLTMRSDLVYAFANDKDHDEMKNAVRWENGKDGEDGKLVFDNKTEAEVYAYVYDEISDSGCYYIYNEDWNETFHFDLDENDLVIEEE